MKLVFNNSTVLQRFVKPVFKKYAKNLVSTSSTDGGFLVIPVKISTTDVIITSVRFNTNTTQDFLISSDVNYLLNICDNSGLWRLDYCGLSNNGFSITTGTDIHFTIKSEYAKVIVSDNTIRLNWSKTATQYVDQPTNIRIFRMPDIGHQWFGSLIIQDCNGNKKHEIVPAIIGESSCLYDKITKQAYISDKIECFDE